MDGFGLRVGQRNIRRSKKVGVVLPGKGVHGPARGLSGAERSCRAAPVDLDFFRLCHFLNSVL